MNNNLWHGYKKEEFEFKGKRAILVFPETKENNGSWLLKTEYWDAFPQVELAMLERGFHLAYLENLSRFATKEDCDRKAEFADYLAGRFGLKQKCVPVGFSCGGAHAINFAGFYPEYVSCVFIDAPVLNFCDYPGRLPADRCENVWENEFVKAYPEITRAGLLNNFLFHPLNRTKALQENKIPIIMLYGTEDKTVNYEMTVVNGISDDLFAPKEKITRQDAVTLIYRLTKMTRSDHEFTTADITFTDKDDVAEYASDALKALISMGVIGGYEDGSFKPEQTITRAETAKMIMTLLDAVG